MDIRPLSDDFAVSPQIHPQDVADLAALGFTTVICNRPDGENPPDLAAGQLRAAADQAGLVFVDNPMGPGGLTQEIIDTQRAAIDGAQGKVLAYCASGNRSSILWALAMAGRMPTDDLIAAGAAYGYQGGQFRALIDKLAQG